jgi:hypothetical protein
MLTHRVVSSWNTCENLETWIFCILSRMTIICSDVDMVLDLTLELAIPLMLPCYLNNYSKSSRRIISRVGPSIITITMHKVTLGLRVMIVDTVTFIG